MRRILGSIVVLFGTAVASSLATAQTTQPADSTARTSPTTAPADPQSLLKQLSDPDWRVRRDAREALIRMGDDAVPLFQALLQSAPDEEARHQAQEALAQIEVN